MEELYLETIDLLEEGAEFDARENAWETQRQTKRQVENRVKRFFDILSASCLLLILGPLILLVALLIRLTGREVLYRQQRVGRGGELFSCYKFRTMRPDAEEYLDHLIETNSQLASEWRENQKLACDPRVTKIGNLLRRTSFDELPQLLNVLKGEMSLIGPRPVVPDEISKYGKYRKDYVSVKPGLTGLWQVSGRNHLAYRRRVSLDVYYIRHRNLLLDLSILVRTVFVVITQRGAM